MSSKIETQSTQTIQELDETRPYIEIKEYNLETVSIESWGRRHPSRN